MNGRSRRPGPSVRARVLELAPDARRVHDDRLATEEPLEIRVSSPGTPSRRVAVTMRTPGHDFELATGWLVHEGVTRSEDIRRVRYCTEQDLSELEEFNVVTVELTAPPLSLPGARVLSSACGVCGSDVVDTAVETAPARVTAPGPVISLETILGMPGKLRGHQPGFGRTGGLHAAGLFGPDGTVAAVREDVGRHNAVDKVVGARLLARRPMPPVLVLSGRIGFELVQKAVVSSLAAVVAVGAPSSLAVSLAQEAGLVLVGFTSPERCVVYAGTDRVGV